MPPQEFAACLHFELPSPLTYLLPAPPLCRFGRNSFISEKPLTAYTKGGVNHGATLELHHMSAPLQHTPLILPATAVALLSEPPYVWAGYKGGQCWEGIVPYPCSQFPLPLVSSGSRPVFTFLPALPAHHLHYEGYPALRSRGNTARRCCRARREACDGGAAPPQAWVRRGAGLEDCCRETGVGQE